MRRNSRNICKAVAEVAAEGRPYARSAADDVASSLMALWRIAFQAVHGAGLRRAERKPVLSFLL